MIAQGIGAGGEVETPEIRAKLDLMRIQDENASLIARAKLKQNLMIGGGVLAAAVVLGAIVFHKKG